MTTQTKCNKDAIFIIKYETEDVQGLIVEHDVSDTGKYEYLERELIDEIANYIPEYSLGHDVKKLSMCEILPMLRVSAKTLIKLKYLEEIKCCLDQNLPYDKWNAEIYKTYNSKGVFSELILHVILRKLNNTIPLISKIYFRDSSSVEVHGFDAVHVSNDEGGSKLWLGETKFYNDGKRGIVELINDLKSHFKKDYLDEQFIFIERQIRAEDSKRQEWLRKIRETKKLGERFNIIFVPLLCIYEDKAATQFIQAVNEELDADTIYVKHIEEMKEYFHEKNDFPNKKRLKYLLILLPVESKKRIVKEILTRIFNMQNS